MQEILDELNNTHAQALEVAAGISLEMVRQGGILLRYGMEYALDDFLVEHSYGHKREHRKPSQMMLDSGGQDRLE